MTRMRARARVVRVVAPLVALSLGVAACSSISGGDSSESGTLVYATSHQPQDFDPLGPASGSTLALNYYIQIFDTLTRVEDGKPSPRLATDWRVVDDTTWEFKLREDVTFHNGEPFDANAVKFSVDRMLDPDHHAAQRGRLASLSGAKVIDDHTVRLITDESFAALPYVLELLYIVPPKYITDNPEEAIQHPVGTGPFKFASMTVGERVNLVANDDYWDGRPKLDELVIRKIPDNAAAINALKAGEVDIIRGVPYDQIESVESDPALKTAGVHTSVAQIMEYDTSDPESPVSDPLVRQAIDYAIDQESIVDDLLGGQVKSLEGQLVPPGNSGHNDEVESYPYSTQKAKTLLKQAGYSQGFDLEILSEPGYGGSAGEVAEAVANQLQQVGIRAKANVVPTSTWIDAVVNNEAGPAFLITWFMFGDPSSLTVSLSSESSIGQYYADATYDKLHHHGATELDMKQRIPIYDKLAQYMHDQSMAAFLYQPSLQYGLNQDVEGFTPRPDEFPIFTDVHIASE